jgi:hypothetical protein
MIGRSCTASTHRKLGALSTEDMKTGLSDYTCPECGTQRYQLVFRVNALNHRVTLAIVCKTCSVRQSLLDDDHVSEGHFDIKQRPTL